MNCKILSIITIILSFWLGIAFGQDTVPIGLNIFPFDNKPVLLQVHPNNSVIMVINADGKSIGLFSPDGKQAIIDWSTGQLKYSGELPVDHSARLFFEALQVILGYSSLCKSQGGLVSE